MGKIDTITKEYIENPIIFADAFNQFLYHGEQGIDRLIPVITLVIYCGSEDWDAPLSLKEMYSNTNNVILAHAPDYHVNLIAPREMSDGEINEFHSNLREVMLYIKYSKDKAKLDKIIEKDSNFRNVERQAADVINVVTGSKLKYPEGERRCEYVLGNSTDAGRKRINWSD